MPSKYIITGSKNFIDKQVELISSKFEDPEVNQYYGDEFNADDFFTFIFSTSLFNDSKLAIVKNAEKIKEIKQIIDESVKSIEADILLLFTDTDVKKLKLPKDLPFEIISEGKVSKYDHLKEVIQMFADKGFKINKNTADDIFEMCMKNLDIVANELDKIDIYYYSNPKPKYDKEILDVISFTKNESIFTFIDMFAARKKENALASLNKMLLAGENMNILFHLLNKRIQQIFQYKISSSLVKGAPFIVDKVKRNASIWSQKQIDQMIGKMADIDVDLKTGKADITQALFILIGML